MKDPRQLVLKPHVEVDLKKKAATTSASASANEEHDKEEEEEEKSTEEDVAEAGDHSGRMGEPRVSKAGAFGNLSLGWVSWPKDLEKQTQRVTRSKSLLLLFFHNSLSGKGPDRGLYALELSLKQIKRESEKITGTYKTYSPLVSKKKLRLFEEQKLQGGEDQQQQQQPLKEGDGLDPDSFVGRTEFLRQRLTEFGFVKEGDTTLTDAARAQGEPEAAKKKTAIVKPEDVDRFGLCFLSLPLSSLWLIFLPVVAAKLQAEEVRKIDYGRNEAISYVASRFPSVYGVIFKVLSEMKRRLPGYSPHNMLDYGTGPGTAIWAAHHVFDGEIREFTGVDLS